MGVTEVEVFFVSTELEEVIESDAGAGVGGCTLDWSVGADAAGEVNEESVGDVG